MKLVFIYGPPAAGKLTVAKELAKRTGFRILHNQLTVDLLLSVFDWGSPQFGRLNELFRLAVIREASRAKLPGLILTFCYAKGSDDRFIKKIINLVESNGGKVHLVQLVCEVKELMRRVTRAGRKAHRKIISAANLKSLLKRYDLFSIISFRKGMTIDSTFRSPQQASKDIIVHYNLDS
ncbi:MAG: AAA family ATPase [Candidatus Edwardsbacteria bacterium]|nr:AAA family ATPase [Candidatus Edwardsbacteria bacterium]